VGLVKPAEPEFDLDDWAKRPYQGRLRLMCQAWAMQGFGAPGIAYLFYALKLVLYIGGFLVFASTTPHLGGLGNIDNWWSDAIVFEKAVLWSLLFESLGFGCGSGPLTGRYLPPVTAFAYWLRPGTTRLAPFQWVPFTDGNRRSVFDVALYVAFVALVVRALVSSPPYMTRGMLIPILAVYAVLGLRDKTVFLAGRSEHYLLLVFVFLFPADLFAGSKAVQFALWFWAATSKLNYHFPNVIAVMMSNNPMLPKSMRKKLYRDYPDDMRGSRLAAAISRAATVTEYTFPIVLLLSRGGTLTTLALIVMVGFHLIILTSFPLGVPLEWNVFFIYSGLVLFGAHSDVRIWSIGSPLLITVLIVCLVVIPILGNLRPDKLSFLPSMRYYAGNWAVSAWLWRPGLFQTLDDKLTKSATVPRTQLEKLFGAGTYEQTLGRIQAFRAMHLHGRALNALLPVAISDLGDDDVRAKGLDAFEIVDGELVAGASLGWNFGEGHLHNEQLLAALQAQCAFAPGELRCVFMESQPAGTATMQWRVVDAAQGQIAEGHVKTADLLALQPWGGDLELSLEPGRAA
jgi:Transmembrane protein of unknown function (DUF3556)